jgi:hypothetical protein
VNLLWLTAKKNIYPNLPFVEKHIAANHQAETEN